MDENQRLSTLKLCNILDTGHDPDYNRICSMAARFLKVTVINSEYAVSSYAFFFYF